MKEKQSFQYLILVLLYKKAMKQRDCGSPKNKLSDPLSGGITGALQPHVGILSELTARPEWGCSAFGILGATDPVPDGNPFTAEPRDSENIRSAFI